MITACAHGAAPPSQAPTAPVKPPPVASSTEETSLQEVLLREVKKVLGTAQSEVRGCYEAVITPLYHPDVAMVLRLAVRADGTVRRVDVVRMEPDVPGLLACFSGVLAALRFPKDSEDWELEFPIKLHSDGMAPGADDAEGEAGEAPKAVP